LRERLVQERLQLAVLGQFKRGKSTFLNALMGAPLLPAAVVPVTAIPTFIAFGKQPLVRISFDGERAPEECRASDPDAIREFLFSFVAEDANPHNRLGVTKAELFYPAPILSGGTVLIDTPGIASTHKHNTEAALRVLSECDAALFVVATDPPITAAEIEYLEQLKAKMSRIFIIVNKIDYVGAEERESLVSFLLKVLHERALLPEETALFQVSARDGLAAKLEKDRCKLERSGLAGIEEHLLGYLSTEKIYSLVDAITRKTSDVLTHASDEIGLRMQALRMPLQDLEAKTRAFENALQKIEDQRRVTRDLLMGDKRRLIEKLELRIEELREQSRSRLAGVIEESLTDAEPRNWETAAQAGLSKAIEGIFETAREEMTRRFAAEADAVLGTFQDRIGELVAAVRRTAADLFDTPFRQDIERDAFTLGEDPYWVTERIASTLIPGPGRLVDRMLPIRPRRARIRTRLVGDTEQLIVRNAENLRWAILRGFDETFRGAIGHIEERLDDAIDTTKHVIERTLADRRNRSFIADPELGRLRKTLGSLTDMQAMLAQLAPIA
jgi:GTP-binding protein EngB required for normal cell division